MNFLRVLKANPYHDEQGLFSSQQRAKTTSSWAKSKTLSKDEATKWLERWHSEHRDVDQASIDRILTAHPEFRHSGVVHRVIEVDAKSARAFADPDDPSVYDTDLATKYAAKHEKKGYVSGSASEKGMQAFERLGGLSDDTVKLYMEYRVKNGLSLKKMAEYSGSTSSKIKQLKEVEEVLFKPSGGEVTSYGAP